MSITASEYAKNVRRKKQLEEEKKLAKEKPYKAPDGTRYKSENEYRKSDYNKALESFINNQKPTQRDSTALQMKGRMAGRSVDWLNRPEKDEEEKPDKTQDFIKQLVDKAIKGEELSSKDSLALYNAPLVDKNITDAESKRFKPQKLKKRDREATKKLEDKNLREGLTELVVRDNKGNRVGADLIASMEKQGGGVKYFMKVVEDGKEKEIPIQKAMYNALDDINKKKLNKKFGKNLADPLDLGF